MTSVPEQPGPEGPRDERLPDAANEAYERERRLALQRVYALFEARRAARQASEQAEREAES